MNLNTAWRIARVAERKIASFVKACPLCGKKPRIEFFYRTPETLFFSEPEQISLRDKRWRLRIACWDNDVSNDENCMIKTHTSTESFRDAICLSVSLWNHKTVRNLIRERHLDKSYEERRQLPQEIVRGILNGAPNVAWLVGLIEGWCGAKPIAT